MSPLVIHTQEPFIFVAKPPGVLSAPGRDGDSSNTISRLVTSEIGVAPLICHRLDQGTSGVMIMALSTEGQRAASSELEHHRVRKSYVALCQGAIDDVTIVDAPLMEDEDAPRGQRARQKVSTEGKPARTLLVPLWKGAGVSLVAARPSTGRTHQVRVHLAHTGHPLVGDGTYGGPEGARVMLHAAHLAMRALNMDLQAGCAIWADLAALVDGNVPSPEEIDRALTDAARGKKKARG